MAAFDHRVNSNAVVAARKSKYQGRRRRACPRHQQVFKLCLHAFCYINTSTPPALAKSRYLRAHHRTNRKKMFRGDAKDESTSSDNFEECPLEYTGYRPMPGCKKYFFCQNGERTSPSTIYTCTEGLLFDDRLLLCNWEGSVTCRLESSEPTGAPSMAPLPTAGPTTSPTTASPTSFTFQKRTLPHGKQVIGYWHGSNDRASSMTPNQIDYTNFSRINYATYTANQNGKIYMRGNGSNDNTINKEDDIFTLLGPYIWTPMNDGTTKEYCYSNPNNENVVCTHHDYARGMLHLAHLEGVEVYPSITLDADVMLLNLDAERFVNNAMRLLEEYDFDGLELNFSMSSASTEEVSAYQSLLTSIRQELVMAMVHQNRSYGLSIVMPCVSATAPNFAFDVGVMNLVTLVDELNLMTFDLYTPSNDLTAPHAPLYGDSMFAHGSDRARYSVDSCINSLVSGGVSSEKINAGLAFNAWKYEGVTSMYRQHATAANKDGPIPYYDIHPRLQEGLANSLTLVRDDATKTEYAYSNEQGGGLFSYEDEQSICNKAEYGLAKGLNGYFVWDITGDILDDGTTPLIDAVNLKLTRPDIDCDSFRGANSNRMEYENAHHDDDKVQLMINGKTISGQFGPPIYYPIFADESCSNDKQTKPSWVTEDHLFRSKEQCCQDLFGWVDLDVCLGEQGYVETNFIRDPTLAPSAMPSVSPTKSPSLKPTPSPTKKPTTSPTYQPSASPMYQLERASRHVFSGLCAKDEAELPHTYRVAKICDGDESCPNGQSCFGNVDLSHTVSAPTIMPTTTSPTKASGIAIQADADATLSQEDADKVFGYHPMLVVDGQASQHYDTILRFDLSLMSILEAGTSVKDVSLRLFVKDGSGYCGSFSTMPKTNWVENSVTYRNAPSADDPDGIVIGQAWNANSGEWFSIDVTGAMNWVWNEKGNNIRAPKNLGIRITSSIAKRCIFSSSNGPAQHSPHLWVRFMENQDEESSPTHAAGNGAGAVTGTSQKLGSVTMPTIPRAHREDGEAALLLAIDDATIVKEKASLNFGNKTSLVVDNDGRLTSDILIKFDITAMYQTVPKKAVLALFIEERCGSAGVFSTTSRFDAKYNELDDNHWNENEVSWSTAPSYECGKYGGGTMIGTFGQVERSKWFGFDVISAFSYDILNEQTTLTFRVSSDEGKHCKYTSIQGGKPAKLMLEF